MNFSIKLKLGIILLSGYILFMLVGCSAPQNKEMVKNYKTVKQKLEITYKDFANILKNTDLKNAYTSSQSNWIRYKESQCKSSSAITSANVSSENNSQYYSCVIQLTEKRIKSIEMYKKQFFLNKSYNFAPPVAENCHFKTFNSNYSVFALIHNQYAGNSNSINTLSSTDGAKLKFIKATINISDQPFFLFIYSDEDTSWKISPSLKSNLLGVIVGGNAKGFAVVNADNKHIFISYFFIRKN